MLHEKLQTALSNGFCKHRVVFAAMAVEMHAGDKQDNIRKPMEEQLEEYNKTLMDAGLTLEELQEEQETGGGLQKTSLSAMTHIKSGHYFTGEQREGVWLVQPICTSLYSAMGAVTDWKVM